MGGLNYLGRAFRPWDRMVPGTFEASVTGAEERMRSEDGMGMVPLLGLHLE